MTMPKRIFQSDINYDIRYNNLIEIVLSSGKFLTSILFRPIRDVASSVLGPVSSQFVSLSTGWHSVIRNKKYCMIDYPKRPRARKWKQILLESCEDFGFKINNRIHTWTKFYKIYSGDNENVRTNDLYQLSVQKIVRTIPERSLSFSPPQKWLVKHLTRDLITWKFEIRGKKHRSVFDWQCPLTIMH